MATNQTQTQQTKKENTYDPSTVYAAAQAGSNQTDLSKYGIDFSQAEQDRIANIFKDSATAAYGAAQNQYSQDIANQQATLSDTIRRSQAEAVATGASRGLQAANELSSILGLQQEAAKGATQIQGDYAQQLAAAQQQAAELQNQRNQVGAEIATADLGAESQKYAANMDYAANDFNRILSEAADLRTSGNNAAADALIKAYMAANSVDNSNINSTLNAFDVQSKPNVWTSDRKEGYIESIKIDSGAQSPYQRISYGDLKDGNTESFAFNDGSRDYYLEASGTRINSSTNKELYDKLNNFTDGSPKTGAIAISGNKAYICDGTNWHQITGRGKGAYKGSLGKDYGWDEFRTKYNIN